MMEGCFGEEEGDSGESGRGEGRWKGREEKEGKNVGGIVGGRKERERGNNDVGVFWERRRVIVGRGREGKG